MDYWKGTEKDLQISSFFFAQALVHLQHSEKEVQELTDVSGIFSMQLSTALLKPDLCPGWKYHKKASVVAVSVCVCVSTFCTKGFLKSSDLFCAVQTCHTAAAAAAA